MVLWVERRSSRTLNPVMADGLKGTTVQTRQFFMLFFKRFLPIMYRGLYFDDSLGRLLRHLHIDRPIRAVVVGHALHGNDLRRGRITVSIVIMRIFRSVVTRS